MKKTEKNLMLLNGIFVTSLVISNVLSSKIAMIGSLTVPAAVVAYPLTFLMTDVIGELWGKEEANRTVRLGVVCQLVSLALIGLALILPVAPFADNQREFSAILGSSFRVVAASMAAYLASQTWDVWVFHRIRGAYIARHGSGHTDGIITQSLAEARAFAAGVDSASIMINASTRLSGGGDYGMGAVVGISTG